jgi:tetratricopeptide (TPR) repeat protein
MKFKKLSDMGIRLAPRKKKEAEQARAKLGVTKSALSQRLIIARSTVQKFFASEVVSYEVFERICTQLKLDWQEFADFGENISDSINEKDQNEGRDKQEVVVGNINKGDTHLDEAFNESQDRSLILSNQTYLNQKPTTPEFIGRDRDLTNLEKISEKAKIVLIKAGGGVGKSDLALEFLETHFKKVIRIKMGLVSENVTPAEEKLSQIIRSPKYFDEEPSRDFGINLDILREKLADQANPIGILIDNLEPALDRNYRFREDLRGYDDLLEVLSDRDVCSFTLITSRRSLVTPRAKVHPYSLEGLDLTAWRQYFHDCKNNVEDSTALMLMHDTFDGNAKAMNILHDTIKNKDRFDGNIEAYWSEYKDCLLANPELETLISAEMDWLRDNHPDAYKLLCRMSCYRYQDVKTLPLKGLSCLLWDSNEPEEKKPSIVDYLSRTSLIEVKKGYYLHPAVREFALSRLKENFIDFELANINAAEFFTKIEFIKSYDDALSAFEAYHHYIAVNKYQLAADVIVAKRDNHLKHQTPLGTSMYEFGILAPLKDHITKVIEYVSEGSSLSRLYNILGDICWLIGDIRQAIDSHENCQKIAIKSKLLNLVAVSFFNIGLCQIEFWEIELAVENLKKCIETSEGTDFDYYANGSYYCLSFLMSVLGFKNRSLDFANKVVPEKNLLDKSKWAIGYKWIFQGKTYLNLDDLEKSSKMYDNALTFAREIHYQQVEANALSGLASIAKLKNDFRKSISYHAEAIIILEKIGATPDLAEAYFQFGLTYQAMGEHEQVEKYRLKALKLFDQMEAEKQKDRVNKAFGGNI